jgi:hypothetical protein
VEDLEATAGTALERQLAGVRVLGLSLRERATTRTELTNTLQRPLQIYLLGKYTLRSDSLSTILILLLVLDVRCQMTDDDSHSDSPQ